MEERIGRYVLQGRIGSGSTGTVYLAADPDLGRLVAVKQLAARLAGDPDFLRRFRDEATTMGRLNHPNCVKVFDFFEEHGNSYLVAEYVDGASLREVLKQAKELTPRQALGVLKGALLGLAHAHSLGLVHRDIKPENLLCDREGTSKLADFGLTTSSAGQENPSQGSPLYMSPEQVEGGPVDQRSDIYSCGAVLFELLTGRAPFVADSPLAVMRMHTAEPLPDPRRVSPGLPAAVAKLVISAMAKGPGDRPQSAEGFLALLEQAANSAYGEGWEAGASIAGVTAAAISLGAAASAASTAAAGAALGGTEVAGSAVAVVTAATGGAGAGAAAGGAAAGGAAGGTAAGAGGLASGGGSIIASIGVTKAVVIGVAAVAVIGGGAFLARTVLSKPSPPASAPALPLRAVLAGYIAGVGPAATLHVYDIDTHADRTIAGTEGVASFQFLAGGKIAYVAGDRRTITSVDPQSGSSSNQAKTTADVLTFGESSDGSAVMYITTTSDQTGQIQSNLVSQQNGRTSVVASYPAYREVSQFSNLTEQRISFSPDDRYVMIVHAEARLSLDKPASNQQSFQVRSRDGTLVFASEFGRSGVWAPDGRLYFEDSASGDVKTLDVKTGTASTFASGVFWYAPSISPDGHWLAYATRPKVTGQPSPTLLAQPGLMLRDLRATTPASQVGTGVAQFTGVDTLWLVNTNFDLEFSRLVPADGKVSMLQVGSQTPTQVPIGGSTALALSFSRSAGPSPKPLALSDVDWNRVSMPASVCGGTGDVQLQDGQVVISSTRWPGFPQVYMQRFSPHGNSGPAVGDLLNDPQNPVAALFMDCDTGGFTGGSGLATAYVIYTVSQSRLNVLGTLDTRHPLDAGVAAYPQFLGAARISPGAIQADEQYWLPGDVTANPSGHQTDTWKWDPATRTFTPS